MSDIVCNLKNCRKTLENEAWITICSHAFCMEHGKQEFGNVSKNVVTCPACNTELSEKFDIVQADLNPSEGFKSIVLAGLKPDIIMDVAMRAISFWNYQIKEETRYHQNVGKYLREKLNNSENSNSALVQNLKMKLATNKSSVDSLQSELEKQKRQNEQYFVMLEEKERKIQKLKYQLDNLKRSSCHINEIDETEPKGNQNLSNIMLNRYQRSSDSDFKTGTTKNKKPSRKFDAYISDSQDSFSFNPVIMNK